MAGEGALEGQINSSERDHLFNLHRELSQLETQELAGAPKVFDKSLLMSNVPELGNLLLGDHRIFAVDLLIRMSKLRDEELRRVALSELMGNVDVLEGWVSIRSPVAGVGLKALTRLLEDDNKDRSEGMGEVINGKLNELAFSLEAVEDLNGILPVVLIYGNEAHKKAAIRIVRDEVDSIGVEDTSEGRLGENRLFLLSVADKELFDNIVFKVIAERFRGIDLDIDSLVKRWRLSFTGTNWEEMVLRNLGIVNDLELYRPGIARSLHEKNNIANFARYPIELLLDQEPNNGDVRRTAAIVTADWDANRQAGFMNDSSIGKLKDLYEAVKKWYRLEVFEVGEIEDFSTFVDNPEKEDTEDFAILQMHGDRYQMIVNDGPRGKIDEIDFLSSGNKLGLRRLRAGAVSLLMSCETGYLGEEGDHWRYLAQKLSIITQGMVIAPAKKAGVKKLLPIMNADNRLIDLDVNFVVGGLGDDSDNPVDARRFVAGNLVTNEDTLK